MSGLKISLVSCVEEHKIICCLLSRRMDNNNLPTPPLVTFRRHGCSWLPDLWVFVSFNMELEEKLLSDFF